MFSCVDPVTVWQAIEYLVPSLFAWRWSDWELLFLCACSLPACEDQWCMLDGLFPQVQPTASHRCCRCYWATRTCSAGWRGTWYGRVSISSWNRSKTATGPWSWAPWLRGRTSWFTGVTELQVVTAHQRQSCRFPWSDLAALMQAWPSSLLKPTWSIKSPSIWTRASAVGSWCGTKASWRRDRESATGLPAVLMCSCCFIGSRGTPSTSTGLRGKNRFYTVKRTVCRYHDELYINMEVDAIV